MHGSAAHLTPSPLISGCINHGWPLRLPCPRTCTYIRRCQQPRCDPCNGWHWLPVYPGWGVNPLQARSNPPPPQFIPTTNCSPITVFGAPPLRKSGRSPGSDTRSTRQLVYFTPSTDKIFLSKNACIVLRIIPESFPFVGSAKSVAAYANHALTCDFPRCEQPLPKPTTLTFPASANNREKIE